MHDFKDKLILITGAARGIGKAIAFEYAKKGARLILVDILGDKVSEAAKDLAKVRHNALAFQCDVSSDTAVESLATTVMAESGIPDIIHNNAYFATHASILDVKLESITKAFDVNVLGYIRIAKAFLPAMTTRKSGWIINTASALAITPPPLPAANFLPYNMCKAADISLSQSMAVCLKPYGIGVTVLIPPLTRTEAANHLSGTAPTEFEENFREVINNMAEEVEEVAQRMVEEIRKQKFFANADRNFEPVLVEWAKNGLDPNVEYLAHC